MTLLAGGVGGARMARSLRAVLNPDHLTVVVNVGDDTERYGVHVSADPDTMLYTLADVVGPQGWGRANDTFSTMTALDQMGFDTSFTLGDADLALCLKRTEMLSSGERLSTITARFAKALGIHNTHIIPATDDMLRTFVQTSKGEWLEFQEYFVDRQHRDEVAALAYHGSPTAQPGPGVVEAIDKADTLVIAPSNPPLSIWPILAIEGIDDAVRRHSRRVAVSPLFGGAALKGPAAEVMSGVGLAPGTQGVLEAYRGVIDHLFVDSADAGDITLGESFRVAIHPADTRLSGDDKGTAFALQLLDTVTA